MGSGQPLRKCCLTPDGTPHLTNCLSHPDRQAEMIRAATQRRSQARAREQLRIRDVIAKHFWQEIGVDPASAPSRPGWMDAAALELLDPPEPPAGDLPVPKGVYWSSEAGNFYDDTTNAGKGLAFYEAWQHRKDEFPAKATTSPGLDLNMTKPVRTPVQVGAVTCHQCGQAHHAAERCPHCC